ncbi:MAG TPA: phage major capsid protein [Phycisphaerae bacterium]|nr:phage major capsid protein [Phycisphaerae bacterium]
MADQAQAIIDKAVGENRENTPEERADTKTLLDQADGMREQADLEERTAKTVAAGKVSEQRISTPPVVKPDEHRAIVMPTFAQSRSFTPALFGTREASTVAAHRSGMWALAVLHGSERAASWCREHGVEMRAQGGTINSAGGYVVPIEMETAVINLMEQYGMTRGNCRISRMTSDTKDVPVRSSGLTAYPIGENAAATESDKAWTVAKLVARKWATLTRYSSEVAEDAVISIADDLAKEAAQAFAYAEDNALWNGDGSGTFHGILGVEDSLGAGSKKTPTPDHDEFSEMTDGDLGVVIGLLPSYARAGAKIFVHPAVNGAVFTRLLQAAGGNTAAMLAMGLPMSYAGLPIVETTLVNSTDGASKVIAYIGDLTQTVLFGDRRAMTMKVSADRYLEYDQMAILATERFDINVFNPGTATAVGPLLQYSTHS